jgi:hypothetical protein
LEKNQFSNQQQYQVILFYFSGSKILHFNNFFQKIKNTYDFYFISMDFISPFYEMKIMKFTTSRPVDLLEELEGGEPHHGKQNLSIL